MNLSTEPIGSAVPSGVTGARFGAYGSGDHNGYQAGCLTSDGGGRKQDKIKSFVLALRAFPQGSHR